MPARAGPYVAGGQIERSEVRLAADRDQQMAAGDPAAVGQDQGRPWLDRRHLSRLSSSGDAARREAIAQPRDQFGILLAGDGCRLDDGDAAAEAGEGVGQLETDRAATEDQQVVGALLQVEDGGVGQVGNPVEAGDRRHRGGASGGDDDPAGSEPTAIDRQAVRGDEAGFPAQHGGAERAEPGLGIGGCDGCDHAMHVCLHRIPVDLRLRQANAEPDGRARRLGGVRRGEQRLARDAAEVEAVAAHAVALDQRHATAQAARRPP